MADEELDEATLYRKKLLKKEKTKLASMCGKKGLSQGGTKADMVDRLVEYAEENGYPKSNRKKSTNNEDGEGNDNENDTTNDKRGRTASKGGAGGSGAAGNGGRFGDKVNVSAGFGGIIQFVCGLACILQVVVAVAHIVDVLKALNLCDVSDKDDTIECIGKALFWDVGAFDTNTLLNGGQLGGQLGAQLGPQLGAQWGTVFTFEPETFLDIWTPVIFAVIGVCQMIVSGKWSIISPGMVRGMAFFIIMALFACFGYAGQLGIIVGFVESLAALLCAIGAFTGGGDPFPTFNY